MKKVFKFIFSGYAGLLLPLAIILILLEKLAHILNPIVLSIENKLHLSSLLGVAAITVISIILLLLLGLLAGILLRLPIVRKWIRTLEVNVLSRIPLYNMLKTVAVEQSGDTENASWKPALFRDDEAFVLCKVIAESEHYYTVMIGTFSLHGGNEIKIVSRRQVILIPISLFEFSQYEKLHGRNCSELVEKYTIKDM